MKVYVVDTEYSLSIFEAEVTKETPKQWHLDKGNAIVIYSDLSYSPKLFHDRIGKDNEFQKTKVFVTLSEAMECALEIKGAAIRKAQEQAELQSQYRDRLWDLKENKTEIVTQEKALLVDK